MRTRGWKALARTTIVATVTIAAMQGCSESTVVQMLLGIDKYNVNQCLLKQQPTLSGVTLSKGTRGTFQEDGGRAIFFVEPEDGGAPVMYDITGLGWSMRTCRAGD